MYWKVLFSSVKNVVSSTHLACFSIEKNTITFNTKRLLRVITYVLHNLQLYLVVLWLFDRVLNNDKYLRYIPKKSRSPNKTIIEKYTW